MLERASASQERDSGAVQVVCPARLHETMTPNRIVRQYPRTHAIFDELLINLAFEGCDCLDEVAWRHGMAGQELLHKLEEVMMEERVRPRHQTPPSTESMAVGVFAATGINEQGGLS